VELIFVPAYINNDVMITERHPMGILTDRQKNRHTGMHAHARTHTHTHTDRHIDRQACRQTGGYQQRVRLTYSIVGTRHHSHGIDPPDLPSQQDGDASWQMHPVIKRGEGGIEEKGRRRGRRKGKEGIKERGRES
jgi:hypothetical protein